jgi:hypothetical protein
LQKFSWHNAEWLRIVTHTDTEYQHESDDFVDHLTVRKHPRSARQEEKDIDEITDDDEKIGFGIGSSNALLSF